MMVYDDDVTFQNRFLELLDVARKKDTIRFLSKNWSRQISFFMFISFKIGTFVI